MPVTARLSRKFYERFGDDLTNELVEWFNQVDTAYRGEFRDLFEVHFARFDAKLEQRVGELRADVTGKLGELRADFTSKLGELRADFTGKLGELRAESMGTLESRLNAFDLKLSAFETRLIRWMFLFWVSTLGTVIALLKL